MAPSDLRGPHSYTTCIKLPPRLAVPIPLVELPPLSQVYTSIQSFDRKPVDLPTDFRKGHIAFTDHARAERADSGTG